MAVTSAPRRRSSDSSVDRAAPSPAKATSSYVGRAWRPAVNRLAAGGLGSAAVAAVAAVVASAAAPA
eukprot:5906066-Pleurochrysis_carterae.AAC.1